MDKHSFLQNIDIELVEKIYQEYLKNPDEVEDTWRKFFDGFEFAQKYYKTSTSKVLDKEFNVIKLIEGYRRRGHLFTETNPVRERRKYRPT